MVYNFVELLIAYFTPYATEQVRIKNLEALCKKMDEVKANPPCCCMGTLHPGECVTRVHCSLTWWGCTSRPGSWLTMPKLAM